MDAFELFQKHSLCLYTHTHTHTHRLALDIKPSVQITSMFLTMQTILGTTISYNISFGKKKKKKGNAPSTNTKKKIQNPDFLLTVVSFHHKFKQQETIIL